MLVEDLDDLLFLQKGQVLVINFNEILPVIEKIHFIRIAVVQIDRILCIDVLTDIIFPAFPVEGVRQFPGNALQMQDTVSLVFCDGAAVKRNGILIRKVIEADLLQGVLERHIASSGRTDKFDALFCSGMDRFNISAADGPIHTEQGLIQITGDDFVHKFSFLSSVDASTPL